MKRKRAQAMNIAKTRRILMLNKFLRCTALFLVSLYGCDRKDPRIEDSIRGVTATMNARIRETNSPVLEKLQQSIVQRLRNSTHKSLQSPQIGGVWIQRVVDDKLEVHLLWIEDQPSIDGVKLKAASGNWEKVYPFDQKILAEMRQSDSKRGVVFMYPIWISKDTPDNLEATLVRGGQEVTPAQEVHRVQ